MNELNFVHLSQLHLETLCYSSNYKAVSATLCNATRPCKNDVNIPVN